jgi:hypothetical protein
MEFEGDQLVIEFLKSWNLEKYIPKFIGKTTIHG